MSDLEKLAEHFEIKYGFQCYQIAIHRDEGYMDENNQPHINHHAHMEFI
ncbi:mobilization protein, partial [Helicobacter pylori]